MCRKKKQIRIFLNKVMQIVIAMLNKSSEIHLNSIGERTLCTDLSVNFKAACLSSEGESRTLTLGWTCTSVSGDLQIQEWFSRATTRPDANSG